MTAAGFDGLDGFKKRVPYAREEASRPAAIGGGGSWLVGANNLHFVSIFFGAKPFASELYWLEIV